MPQRRYKEDIMKLKFVKGLTCLMLFSVMLGGCGQDRKLDETSVYIRKDGSVSSAVYEPFDTGIYNKEELQVFVEDAVRAYNQSQSGVAEAYADDTDEALLVAVDSLKVEGDNAVLMMEYASCEDYLQFNESEGSIVQLASGTVSGAANSGIDLSQFELLDMEGAKVSGEEIDGNYHMIFVEGTSTIVVEGTIQYATEDVQLKEDDTASVSSSGGLSCIVFK